MDNLTVFWELPQGLFCLLSAAIFVFSKRPRIILGHFWGEMGATTHTNKNKWIMENIWRKCCKAGLPFLRWQGKEKSQKYYQGQWKPLEKIWFISRLTRALNKEHLCYWLGMHYNILLQCLSCCFINDCKNSVPSCPPIIWTCRQQETGTGTVTFRAEDGLPWVLPARGLATSTWNARSCWQLTMSNTGRKGEPLTLQWVLWHHIIWLN